MPQCTAPVRGHIRGGGADCPVHGGRGYGGYYGGYERPRAPQPVYTPPPAPKRHSSFASRSSGGGSSRSASSRSRRVVVTYSPAEYAILNPVRQQVERLAQEDRRDLFLCHAWGDRAGAALDFYNLLTGLDVKVWFSEKDVPLGTPLMRQIDKGLRNSRAGIVLVTPELLRSLNAEGIADKELSTLLSTGRVIPILHGATHEQLLDVSPMLASHRGLTTDDYASLEAVAAMVADTTLLD